MAQLFNVERDVTELPYALPACHVITWSARAVSTYSKLRLWRSLKVSLRMQEISLAFSSLQRQCRSVILCTKLHSCWTPNKCTT